MLLELEEEMPSGSVVSSCCVTTCHGGIKAPFMQLGCLQHFSVLLNFVLVVLVKSFFFFLFKVYYLFWW